MKNASFKAKLLALLVGFMAFQAVLIPVIFSQLQSKIVEIMEAKSIQEQKEVFLATMDSHLNRLGDKVLGLINSTALDAIRYEPVDFNRYSDQLQNQSTLLAGEYGVTVVQTFDASFDRQFSYNLSGGEVDLSAAEPRILQVVKNASDSLDFQTIQIVGADGTPYLGLAVPGTNSAGEIMFIHVFIARMEPFLAKFAAISNYPTTFTVGSHTTMPENLADTVTPLIEHDTDAERFKALNKWWRKRELSVSEDERLMPGAVATVYAEMTELVDVFQTTEIVVDIGFLAMYVIFGLIFMAFVQMLLRPIERIIHHFHDTMDKVSAKSAQVSKSSEIIMRNLQQEGQAVNSTVAAADEISSMLSRGLALGENTSNLSKYNAISAQNGVKLMSAMSNKVKALTDANSTADRTIRDANSKVSNLLTVVNEIGNKTGVINDITFSTKLLSFNASVEAARAGEHGRGFAVVADEIGQLAGHTSQAAEEINHIVDSSTKNVTNTIEEASHQTDKILADVANELVSLTSSSTRCEKEFFAIVNAFEAVDSQIQELKSAISEQSKAVSDITQSMHQINDHTDSNMQASQSNAKLASELGTMSTDMRDSVVELEGLFFGKKS